MAGIDDVLGHSIAPRHAHRQERYPCIRPRERHAHEDKTVGIRARWQAGYEDTQRLLERAPWTAPVDPEEGVVIHDPIAADGHVIA
jgi:Patatin phospholipase